MGLLIKIRIIKKQWKKLIFFLILLAFFTEISLRLMGYGYKIATAPRKEYQEGVFTILCVGESSTIGYGLKPIDNYPNQLEFILNRESKEEKYQVFYDGAMGANSSRMLMLFPEFIEKYRPNLVIFMVGVNNHLDLDKSNNLLFNQNSFISNTYYRVSVFLHKFRLFKLLKFTFYAIINYQAREWTPFDHDAPLPHIEQLFNNILRYDLSEMIKICKFNNIRVLISGYPLAHLREIHMEIAKDEGAPFVDNWDSFKEIKKKGKLSQHLLKDKWHPNQKGYSIIAGNIYESLTKNALVPIKK